MCGGESGHDRTVCITAGGQSCRTETKTSRMEKAVKYNVVVAAIMQSVASSSLSFKSGLAVDIPSTFCLINGLM